MKHIAQMTAAFRMNHRAHAAQAPSANGAKR